MFTSKPKAVNYAPRSTDRFGLVPDIGHSATIWRQIDHMPDVHGQLRTFVENAVKVGFEQKLTDSAMRTFLRWERTANPHGTAK